LCTYNITMKLEINKGNRFGNFEVIKELPKYVLPSGQTNRVFLCECICGKTKEIRLLHLTRLRINSCGCLDNRYKSTTETDRYIRKIWRAIKYRTQKDYCESHLYFDKGVKVCDNWLNHYVSFKEWALKNKLRKGYHIDRIDGNKGYSPDNCRVVTPLVNANNRFNTYIVSYKGKDYPFMDLIRMKGLENNHNTIRGRLKRNWSVEKAVDTPIRKGNYK